MIHSRSAVFLLAGLATTIMATCHRAPPPKAGVDGPETGAPLFMWRISDGPESTETLGYLLGSIHASRNSQVDAAISEAYANSDRLLLEIDMSAEGLLQFQADFAGRAFYAGGNTLDKEVSPELLSAITKAAQEGRFGPGIDENTVKAMRPWALANTLMTNAITGSTKEGGAGMSLIAGLDVTFAANANGSKKIEGLETGKEQLDLLSEGDLELFSAIIKDVLCDDCKEMMVEHVVSMHDAYWSGDIEKLREIVALPKDAGEHVKRFMNRMTTQRDQRMATRLVERLKAGERPFVVVGIMHTIGDSSMVDHLMSAGYHLERVAAAGKMVVVPPHESWALAQRPITMLNDIQVNPGFPAPPQQTRPDPNGPTQLRVVEKDGLRYVVVDGSPAPPAEQVPPGELVGYYRTFVGGFAPSMKMKPLSCAPQRLHQQLVMDCQLAADKSAASALLRIARGKDETIMGLVVGKELRVFDDKDAGAFIESFVPSGGDLQN